MPNNRKDPQTSANSAISEAQNRAIAMAALGETGRDIANALGVNESTVSRWKQTPEFQAGVNAIQHQGREVAIAKLRILAEKAVNTIEDVMVSPSSPPGDRLKAAAIVLDRLGLDTVPEVGPTDPQVIVRQAEYEAEQAKLWDCF
jgi:hypothetical protein